MPPGEFPADLRDVYLLCHFLEVGELPLYLSGFLLRAWSVEHSPKLFEVLQGVLDIPEDAVPGPGGELLGEYFLVLRVQQIHVAVHVKPAQRHLPGVLLLHRNEQDGRAHCPRAAARTPS